jgi:hypothetical protein
MRYKIFIDIISSLFILLFVYTAVSKWLDFASFTSVVAQSPLIGSFPYLVAWLLPVFELWVAGLLLFRRSRIVGLYAALFLMIAFTGYISSMLLFSSHLPCSCGGVIRYLSWRTHLIFNTVWIALAIIAIKLDASKGVSRKPL